MATLMVLGGGGALGAYQAGCLVALAETGALPDALFGCSAGARVRTRMLGNGRRQGAGRVKTG